jgi:prepilin-type N-terminal cleavage/methylation domain-containing protein
VKAPRSPRTQAARRAFTLIELLVVIAVIAILASIVFTVSRKAIESSQMAKCAGNLRGIFVYLGAYAADNNGKYPNGNSSYKTTTELVKEINPYVPVGDRKIFYCPAHKRENGSVYNYTTTRWVTGGISYHYYTRNGTSSEPLRGLDNNNQLLMSDKFNGNTDNPSVVTSSKGKSCSHPGGLNLMRLNGSIETQKYGVSIKTW